MDLADGVYALDLTIERPDGDVVIRPTAVETPKGLLLVDTGIPGQEGQIADALAAHGLDIADVHGVVLTHHDGDHAGSLSAVVDAGDDPVVYAHEAAAPFVDGREFPIKSDPDDGRYPAVPVDVELQDGVTFRTDAGPMRAVFTPGHAPGHLAFHLPDVGLLLAGDALRVEDGELVGFAEHFTPDEAEATRSVARLAELNVETVHCFHGGSVAATADDIAAVYDSLAAQYLD
ncbi:MBL fold metallo-hydrolase [Halobaculum marinum]|uniref:MBL fold metallo-hydrolase n=1 Tax=Halobaculum marinum TaxID=3031996 RepID=A0ABD5WR20_9EURY|nr:MBL fold metallo-hydrolase [Halobaculum sp. DT55]